MIHVFLHIADQLLRHFKPSSHISVPVAFQTAASDGFVHILRDKSNPPVSQIQQIFRHLPALQTVVHRDIGESRLSRLRGGLNADGAENIRHFQFVQLLLGMPEHTAQKYDPPQPLLLLQLQRHIQFIFLCLHMPQHQRVPLALRFVLYDLYHLTEKRVCDAFYQHGNALGICAL